MLSIFYKPLICRGGSTQLSIWLANYGIGGRSSLAPDGSDTSSNLPLEVSRFPNRNVRPTKVSVSTCANKGKSFLVMPSFRFHIYCCRHHSQNVGHTEHYPTCRWHKSLVEGVAFFIQELHYERFVNTEACMYILCARNLKIVNIL